MGNNMAGQINKANNDIDMNEIDDILNSVEADISEQTNTTEKKKRGRPRKVKEPEEVNATEAPKRKRGRPKKIKEPEELKNPENSISPVYTFSAQRRDIDINKHMHNIYYLDYALEALPQEVYDNLNCSEFEIMYKTGIKFGNTVNCFYVKHSDAHFIVMKDANDNKLYAIVKFKI